MSSPPPATPPKHKLTIRRRQKTSATPNGTPAPKPKRTDREFLSLLSGSEYESAVAFMGVASVDARIHLNTVMKRATPALRSKVLEFLEVVDVSICERIITNLSGLGAERAANLFCLQFELDWDRYLKVQELPQEVRVQFLDLVYDMSPADRKNVFDKSYECNMTLEMFLHLLRTQKQEDKCPICTARRRIAKEVNRINNYHDKTAEEKYKRPTSVYDNDLLEKRDWSTDPVSDFYSFDVDKETGIAHVMFSDAGGQAIASKKHIVDTKIICMSCKRDVYQFALRVGNNMEMWHTLWQDRLELHGQARALDVRKSEWWVQEQRDIEFVDTVKAIVQANKNTRKRKRDAKKADERGKKLEREQEALELKKLIHSNMIEDALSKDGKWIHQELSSQQKSLQTRNLGASLEFETEYGRHVHAQKTRKNPRSTKREEFHHASGIPLTKEAASAAFGTAPLVVKDESRDLAEWKFDFGETKSKLDWRRDEQRRQREAAERQNFEDNMNKWLRDAQEVKDRINAKFDRQKWLRMQKIGKREELKRINHRLREEMRKEAERRELEEARAEHERQQRLIEEETREEKARFMMSVCEAEQRAIDRFWGIPTEREKARRLEEFLRKQFEARVRDKRAMMVAVGGEISVSKNVALDVPEVLGLEKFRIKTLQISGKELCEDPLGKMRRPIGQR